VNCKLDYKHAAVWCDACWADQQQSRQINATEDLSEQLIKLNTLAEYLPGPSDIGVTAPPKPPPMRPPEPSPAKSESPGMGYKWRT